MGRHKKYVKVPVALINKIGHAELMTFIPRNQLKQAMRIRRDISLSKQEVKAATEMLSLRGEVLIRCSAKNPTIARIVKPAFYKVKLNYPANRPEVIRKVQRTRKANLA